MNIAIVITASKYKPPQTVLPACDCDAALIDALIDGSAHFDDKLILRDIADSATVKKQLTEFIARHKGTDIDQVFFYFSGHGAFSGDEMFYLLPDYDAKQRRQTTLENSELDSLLRGLKPKLAVKVIDACHSGVPYIKDSEAFQNYIKGTKDAFSKCYFLFSSHLEQASYQNSELSFFTRSFVQAIAEHTADRIRVKDIIDHVADEFAGNPQQTPFFVVQADFTEPFCRVTDSLRNRLLALLAGKTPTLNPLKAAPGKSIADLVAQEAEAYCSEMEATAILNKMADYAQTGPGKEEAAQLYDVKGSRLDDYSEIPQIDSVGAWLQANKHGLFVTVLTKTRTERYEDPISRILNPLGDEEKRRYKTRHVEYAVGIRPSTTMPYWCIRVCATPKFPNIEATVAYILPLVSETDLRLFSGFGRYKKAGWTEQELHGEIEWRTFSLSLKHEPEIQEAIRTIFRDFWTFTLTPIKKRLGLVKDEEKRSQESEVGMDDTATPQRASHHGEEGAGKSEQPPERDK